ncbi:MAG TPA: hypothetical protein ENN22_01505 [bacterium]|nr:hypothetical protein [bacterium]
MKKTTMTTLENFSFDSSHKKNYPYSVALKIADLPIVIMAENRDLIESAKTRYQKFLYRRTNFCLAIDIHLSDNIHFPNPDGTENFFNEQVFQEGRCCIRSNYFTGYIDINNNYGKVLCSNFDPLSWLEHFLRIAYAVVAIKNETIVFHGAGLIADKKGLVFFGPSGCGKSTVTRLSKHCAALGDDMIAIKKKNDHFNVYATPFNSEKNGFLLTNTEAVIKGFYRLIQHKTTFINKMSRANALAELLASISSINKNYQGSLTALSLCTQLVERIPCYELYFTPDNLFWRFLDGDAEQISD